MDTAEVATLPDRPDVWFGFGVGTMLDGADRFRSGTAFRPGLTVRLPLTLDAERWRVRAEFRVDGATGSDRVEWYRSINGEPVRFYDEEHWTGLLLVSGLVGVDAMLPISDSLRPFIGVGVGPAVVWNLHSFGGNTQVLLDPAQNDLDDPLNVDPFSVRWVPLTTARVGVDWKVASRRSVWLQIGAGGALVRDAELRKAPPDLGAVRTEFSWSGVDIVAGYAVRW